jgi:hypothetical protein
LRRMSVGGSPTRAPVRGVASRVRSVVSGMGLSPAINAPASHRFWGFAQAGVHPDRAVRP